jgi:hypothetical protein
MAYHKKRAPNYCCLKCKEECVNLELHQLKCTEAKIIKDFIECAICNKRLRKISPHIDYVHKISKDSYNKKFPEAPLISETCVTAYRSIPGIRKKTNFRNKLKSQGRLDELDKFNKRIAYAVSKSIISNPVERLRRAKLLGTLNKTDRFKEKASETAKKTSARPEILAERTARLLHQKINNSNSHWKSKPESELYIYCKSLNFNFKNSQTIKRECWNNKSKRHQIDILSADSKIIIEYDGIGHFKNIYGAGSLEKAKITDSEVNSLINEEYLIIRIGYDQFKYRCEKGFTSESLGAINHILNAYKNGLFLIGDVYGKNNFLRTNWRTSNSRS